MADKLLNDAVHGAGATLVGVVDLAARHEFHAVLFGEVFLWNIRQGEVLEEKNRVDKRS